MTWQKGKLMSILLSLTHYVTIIYVFNVYIPLNLLLIDTHQPNMILIPYFVFLQNTGGTIHFTQLVLLLSSLDCWLMLLAHWIPLRMTVMKKSESNNKTNFHWITATLLWWLLHTSTQTHIGSHSINGFFLLKVFFSFKNSPSPLSMITLRFQTFKCYWFGKKHINEQSLAT